MTAHLNPSRSPVANGIDVVEAVDKIFITGDIDDWVPCPDGDFCPPGNTCCDGDQDGDYECCTHLSALCCPGFSENDKHFCCYEGATCTEPDENNHSFCDYGAKSSNFLLPWMYKKYPQP